LDMMAAYSAVSHGHRYPRLLAAMSRQANELAVTSRMFHNTKLGPFAKKLCELSGFTKMIPMNTGVEAVETAFKLARKWAYVVKKVPENQANVIVCNGNFHGRTMLAISLSSEPNQFGPAVPNIRHIDYNDVDALSQAIDSNTAAFIVEPIQGEGGIVVPNDDYLDKVHAICKKHRVLLLLDEVQTGLGRTGKMFAFQHSNIQPDGIMVGKALSGGTFPISAFLTTNEVASAIQVGDHGSTFGGSALACAVALEALAVVEDEHLVENSAAMGEYLLEQLKTIDSPFIDIVRGKGLFVGVKLIGIDARVVCEALLKNGVVSKDTKGCVIRFAPPLTIKKEEIDFAVQRLKLTLNQL